MALLILLVAALGMVTAMLASRVVPQAHLGSDGRDVIKLGLALVATLVALVLGLMIATAKSGFDAQGTSVRQLAANLILLDRVLAEYGPEAAPPRELLKIGAVKLRQRLWPDDGGAPPSLEPDEARKEMHAFSLQLMALAPSDDSGRFLKARAMQLTTDLGASRFQLFVQGSSRLPGAFTVILAAWLFILFAGYGLIAPRNGTVVAALSACSLSVAAALFLIIEFTDPFDGAVRVSGQPITQAIIQMGQ